MRQYYLKRSKLKYRLSCLMLLIGVYLMAQTYEYKDFEWSSDPISMDLTETELQESEIILLENKVLEYYFEGENLFQYTFYHKIKRLNTDKGIESNNRIYIPVSNESELQRVQARVIENGKVVSVLDRGDIKQSIDEKSGNNYEYFALEGLNKGSSIEFFYILKSAPYYTGRRINVQTGITKKQFNLEVISPENLFFASKSYNGLQEMMVDTSYIGKNCLKLNVENVLPLKDDESMSAYKTNVQHLLLKLESNSYTGASGIISFGPISGIIYDRIFEREKSEIKLLKKIIKGIDGLNKAEDTKTKIRMVENHMKENYIVLNQNLADLDNIPFIYEKKACSELGMTKILANIYKILGIKQELVLACNRFEFEFVSDFEVYNFLDRYLIYFPGENKYLEPGGQFNRFGYVSPSLMHNNGLFLKKVSLGDFESAVGKVKFIDAIGSEYSQDNLKVHVEFDPEESQTAIQVNREITGYNALNYQPFYSILEEKDLEEINESLIHFVTNKEDISKITIENEGSEHFGIDPLIVKGEVLSSEFIQKAGPKYLFKIGELIGPQMEMYQEHEREQPIMNQFNRKYVREIRFKIPEGYKVTNLEDLNLNVRDSESDHQAAFLSSYTFEGDELVVEAIEYYNQIEYAPKDYDQFREVINAAADFNKLVIYLEKL